jgi:type II secretory ATPase GspE/PulE/Tfp pilus assembly ATPase PilB-like protein
MAIRSRFSRAEETGEGQARRSVGDEPSSPRSLSERLGALSPADPRFATEAVDLILLAAKQAGASDVHWQPGPDALECRWRLDGVLQPAATLPASLSPNVIARLKVLAELLTYRTDIPQEGRIRRPIDDVEMRLSTFPTLHGEKAVVRLFAGPGRFQRIADLGLPDEIAATLQNLLDATSGAIVLAGPAGAGKTTSLYACLRDLAARSARQRSLVSLEDPIEAAVAGVSQSQVNLAAGLTLEVGLRALLRQDPEVIAVGEIRDRSTAEVALQASLTGHLLLTTFHAGSACEVIGRLLDMGLEPYMIRSGLIAVVAQRLVRRLCEACRVETHCEDDFLGLSVSRAWCPGTAAAEGRAPGCEVCSGTGYHGRAVIAELLLPETPALSQAVLARGDVRLLERIAIEAGMTSRWSRAAAAVEAGVTSPAEIRRVLGLGPGSQASPGSTFSDPIS